MMAPSPLKRWPRMQTRAGRHGRGRRRVGVRHVHAGRRARPARTARAARRRRAAWVRCWRHSSQVIVPPPSAGRFQRRRRCRRCQVREHDLLEPDLARPPTPGRAPGRAAGPSRLTSRGVRVSLMTRAGRRSTAVVAVGALAAACARRASSSIPAQRTGRPAARTMRWSQIRSRSGSRWLDSSDREPPIGHRAGQRTEELPASERVECRHRLVEQEQLGTLAHARAASATWARMPPDRASKRRSRGMPRRRSRSTEMPGVPGRVHVRAEREVVGGGPAPVERDVLGEVADHARGSRRRRPAPAR